MGISLQYGLWFAFAWAHTSKKLFVHPVAFYENALGFAENNLSREDLICTPLFENPDLLRNVGFSPAGFPRKAFRRRFER